VRTYCCVGWIQEFSGAFTTKDRYNAELVYAGRLHKSTDAAGRAVLEAEMEHTDPWTGERIITTLLDHRVYMQYFNDSISMTTPTRVVCKPKNLVPPMGDLDQLFQTGVAVPASALDASNTGVQQCIDAGERWLLRWGAQELVYCRPQNDVHTVGHGRLFVCMHACARLWAMDECGIVGVTSVMCCTASFRWWCNAYLCAGGGRQLPCELCERCSDSPCGRFHSGERVVGQPCRVRGGGGAVRFHEQARSQPQRGDPWASYDGGPWSAPPLSQALFLPWGVWIDEERGGEHSDSGQLLGRPARVVVRGIWLVRVCLFH